LIGRRLLAIEDERVLLAQSARAAAGAVADLAQDLFPAHFEPDPLGRFGQFVDQSHKTRRFVFTHRSRYPRRLDSDGGAVLLCLRATSLILFAHLLR
jgi:hypothetical protein